MTLNNRFLWSVVAFVIGVLLSFRATNPSSKDPDESIPSFYKPSIELEPADVVERQLTALQNASGDPATFRYCYQFAAPSNRARVGSLDSFTKLLQKSVYSPLIGHHQNLVGRPTIVGGEATLLVTVVNKSGLPSVFRFILRKQKREPFKDCWMTTAVFPAPPPNALTSGRGGSTARTHPNGGPGGE